MVDYFGFNYNILPNIIKQTWIEVKKSIEKFINDFKQFE